MRDVVGAIEAGELHDMILCGHSYGGMVITAVADRLPGRVKALVYLDAFLPEHGQSLIQLLDVAILPEVAQVFIGGFRGSAQTDHTGMMAPIPAEVFNIAEANRAWVNRRCVPQALATFEMPVLLSGGGLESVGQRVYVLATHGLGAVLTASEWAFVALKVVGAAYLVWLGTVFALLTFAVKGPVGAAAGLLSAWLRRRPSSRAAASQKC